MGFFVYFYKHFVICSFIVHLKFCGKIAFYVSMNFHLIRDSIVNELYLIIGMDIIKIILE